MSHKISVIVPIYKTGKILARTLNAIKHQSFRDFECILVDDGSNDNNTFLICKKFVTEDRRFKYYTKKNEGIEKTRIFGVKRSTSSLLAFCDHDDYYEPDALRLLYDNWLISKADIVVANCYLQRFKQISYRKKYGGLKNNLEVDRTDFMARYYKNFFGINIFPVSTWGKLYSKDLFDEELKCFGYNFFEDTVINVQLFSRISKVHFIPQYIYTHIYGGLSSKFNVKSVFSGYIDIYQFRNTLLKKNILFDKLNEFLLIEFKNIVTQYVMLMIENDYKIHDFIIAMDIIQNSDILLDTLHADFEKGRVFEYIEKRQINELFHDIMSEYSLKKKMKAKIKNLIKSLI